MNAPVQLGHGIRLLSGVMFDYAEPAACEVTIEDIAAALSKVCRFAGHLPRFYSVAQHCVNASRIVDDEFAFVALMHDTAEAFTNDLPTPLKIAIPAFKDIEHAIEAAMAARFGFAYPLPDAVKVADLQMLLAEKLFVKGDWSSWAVLDGVTLPPSAVQIDVSPWSPERAELMFLARYEELRPALVRLASGEVVHSALPRPRRP